MKKWFIFVALVIVLGGAGTPALNGMLMEKRVRQSFEEINHRDGASRPRILFEIIRYERGFFSSEIEWKIVSGMFENICGTYEIVFVDRAGHGLTGVSTVTSLEKNQWFTDFMNEKLKGKNPLTIKTEFNYSGRMKSMFALDAVSFTDGSDTYTVKPGQANVSVDWRKDNILLTLNFAGLDMVGKKTAVSNMAFDYEFLSHPKEAAVSIKIQGRMDSFQSGAREIKNAAIGLHINHMDAEGYKDLRAVFQEGLADIVRGGSSTWQYPDAVRQTMERQVTEKGFEWVGICEKLLKSGLEIEVSGLKAQLPEGDIEANGRIRLEKDLPLEGLISLIMAPSNALAYISLKSHISLPKSPDLDDRMLLSPLFPEMSTGLFIMEKDRLIHTAETRDGKLFLNEKEVSIK